MIQFFDLAAQQEILKGEIEKRIQNVLNHGKYILGPEVAELEEEDDDESPSSSLG